MKFCPTWLHVKLLMMLVAAGLATGCGGGSGDSTSGGNGDPTPEPDPPAAEEATLAQIQEDIFGAICTECHTGANAPQGLQLSSEQESFDNLVNQPSSQQPDILRVDPGNPDDSYLVMKIEGHPDITGSRMPQGMPALSEDQINLIRDWITNGAPREGTGEMAAQLTLSDSQKMADGIQFNLRFSRPIQDDTFDPNSLQVYFSNRDTRWLASPDDYAIQRDGQTITVVVFPPATSATEAELVIDNAYLTGVLDVEGRQIASNSNTGSYSYPF